MHYIAWHSTPEFPRCRIIEPSLLPFGKKSGFQKKFQFRMIPEVCKKLKLPQKRKRGEQLNKNNTLYIQYDGNVCTHSWNNKKKHYIQNYVKLNVVLYIDSKICRLTTATIQHQCYSYYWSLNTELNKKQINTQCDVILLVYMASPKRDKLSENLELTCIQV
jgi:hypothetical protein